MSNDFFQFTKEILIRVYDQTPVPHKPNKTAITVKLHTNVAELLLKGHWLIQAGFNIDSNVTVNVQHGKLTIQIE